MENYIKDKTIGHDVNNPFKDILKSETPVCDVNISEHSQVNKVLSFALRKSKNPDVKILMLKGQGKAIDKTNKVAEILMTKVQNLHRCDAVGKKQFEDVWVAKEENSLLDDICVIRSIQVKFVLLAKDSLPEEIQAHPQRLQIHGPPKQQKNNQPKNQRSGKPRNNRKRDKKNSINEKQTAA